MRLHTPFQHCAMFWVHQCVSVHNSLHRNSLPLLPCSDRQSMQAVDHVLQSQPHHKTVCITVFPPGLRTINMTDKKSDCWIGVMCGLTSIDLADLLSWVSHCSRGFLTAHMGLTAHMHAAAAYQCLLLFLPLSHHHACIDVPPSVSQQIH